VLTALVCFLCLTIRRRYLNVKAELQLLDTQLKVKIKPSVSGEAFPLKTEAPTAAILINHKHPGVGMHTLLWMLRMFPNHFKNILFISVGEVDVESFSGQEHLEHLKIEVEQTLNYFKSFSWQNGLASASYEAYGTDVVGELTVLAESITEQYHDCIFFASKLVFEQESLITWILHNQTAYTLQRRLHLDGIQMVILPVKITSQH
jgi:hypothetical protein